jgi:hypothetical protein
MKVSLSSVRKDGARRINGNFIAFDGGCFGYFRELEYGKWISATPGLRLQLELIEGLPLEHGLIEVKVTTF